MKLSVNPYLKFVVSLLGVAWSAYQAAAPPAGQPANWSVVAASVVTSVLVWLVPNTAKPVAAARVQPPSTGTGPVAP